MASELQNSIFSAFDTIIEQRIEKLELDKTIVASIEKCENALERKYRVQYKGGSMIAYAQSDETYAPHVSVYVSIPQNDFSQKKWILGKVSNFIGDRAITEVSAAIEDYQLVGNNTISLVTDEEAEFGLKSYQPAVKENETQLPAIPNLKQCDIIPLYVRGEEERNKLQINEIELKQYIENSKALLLEACFRTDLDSTQRNMADKGAEYGLEFNFIFEDGNGEFESLGSQFEDFADITVITQKKDIGTDEVIDVTLADIDENITDKFAEDETKYLEYTLTSAKAALDNFLLENTEESQANTLVELYTNLVNDLIAIWSSPNTSIEDVIAERSRWFMSESQTPRDKRVVYSLDSNNMLGNPFLYRMSTEQYNIYPVDSGRFKYIESIVFYCQHFNASADYNTMPSDIFVSDIELYGLTELSAKNGDYCLKMQFPQGQMFEVADNPDEADNISLMTKAKFYYKQESLTTGVDYYWFVQDGRVNSASHKDYHIRGGVGWKYLDNTQDENSNDSALRAGDFLITYAKDNTAYENVYKCVVVYQDTMVLKSEFSLYNTANRRIIEINSTLGTKFDFDIGKPTLTCLLLDDIMEDKEVAESYPDGYEDYTYKYVWMRRDESGQIITFDKTYQEYKELYNNASSFGDKTLFKKKMEEMKDVELNKNVLVYPASKIAANTTATFECYVYRTKNDQEIYLGAASITLLNKTAPVRDEYYIVIDNGNQVFQYNEAGCLPQEETSKNPIKIKPLTCHLYNYLGQEVNSSLYTVTWEYPKENTLILSDSVEGLVENPRTGLIQWLHGSEATFTVALDYDYQKQNNQIKCIVEYENNEITKETEFYFGKIGDNGTNGTNVVATIGPWGTDNDLDDEPLTLIVTPKSAHWNSGLAFNEATTPLALSLFRNNEYIEPSEYKNVKWTMAGGATKSNRFKAQGDTVSPQLAHILTGEGKYSNYIIKGEAKLDKVDGDNETQTHYAFYPICIIEYEQEAHEGLVSINKDKTLTQILYNADGRNPLYNENQGVFFNFSEDNQTPLSVSWEAIGGLDDAETLPAFDLYYDKDIAEAEDGYYYAAGTLSRTLGRCPYVYIKPKDVYAGAAQNNLVKATIYSNATVYDGSETSRKTTVKIATVYVPIYMSLNLYGLASLNAWDGNTIEINEDNNYIMAPQIGAGIKNEDNTFTGVVMGKATTYDMEEEQVGLLGYSGGRQSIFLDAKTGNATFGLPEIDERDPNQQNLNEGRIELRPGGLSSIANWKINSRMLFNIPDANKNNSEEYNTWGGLGEPYADLQKLSDEYIKSIPHNKSGVLISSDPAYISIKGKPLTTNEDIDFTLTNTIVKPDDTFELQLNPNDDSIFTIYRHTRTTQNPDMGVKIDSETGELYVGIVFIADNETDSKEDFTKYSIPNRVNGEIIGWTALLPDPIYKEYLIPCEYSQIKHNEKDEEIETVVWAIRAVPSAGYYPIGIFEKEETDPSVWRREKRVGINEQGRFYTNALRSSSSALNIDNVGAFGKSADTGKYVGASFEVGATEDDSFSLIKMFTSTGTNNDNLNNPGGTLYISGSSSDEDEYIRPTRLYGNSITLLADDSGKNNTYYAQNRMRVDGYSAFIGNVEKTATSFEEERAPEVGNYLFFNSVRGNGVGKDETRFRSLYHTNVQIGESQEESEERPWLLTDTKFAIPTGYSEGANLITQVSEGTLANYVYGKNPDSSDEKSAGHMLNYVTGDLQLNQTANINTNKQEEPIYGIDKGLQINKDNIILGNIDSLKLSEDYDRNNWSSATTGTVNLTNSISGGFRFESDDLGTTLLSAPKIALYSQRGIDIKSLKTSSGTGNIIRLTAERKIGDSVEDCYLILSPNTESNNIRLHSQYGDLSFNKNVRGTLTTGDKNGIEINPGFSAGYGVFTGEIGAGSDILAGASIYAAKDIYLNNFTWAGDWDEDRLNSMGTNKDHYLTYILVQMWKRVAAIENSYASKSWVQNQGYLTSVPYHTHDYASSSHIHTLDTFVVTKVNTEAILVDGKTVNSVTSVNYGAGTVKTNSPS